MTKLKIAIIGLGKQGAKYLQAVSKSEWVELVAVCDVDKNAVNNVARHYNCGGYTTVKDLIQNTKLDFAIVAVPHNSYFNIIKMLAENNINVLKEKPFATSLDEAYKIKHVVDQHKIKLMISTQRRFDPDHQKVLQLLPELGDISQIEGKYTFCRRAREGWRYIKEDSMGGVMLDMGYHIIDLLIWYWGMPQGMVAKQSGVNAEMEDNSVILFNYPAAQPGKKIIGTIMVSREYVKKQEKLKIMGSKGYLKIDENTVSLFDVSGKGVFSMQRSTTCIDTLKAQVEHFAAYLSGKVSRLTNNFEDHFAHLMVIDTINKLHNEPKVIETKNSNKSDFQWPIITDKTRSAVLKQLDESISIYDRSGVIKEFEDKFATYHNKKYSLLSNSGTSAIYAMFGSLELGPGDEVLAPVYTFPATVSPLVQSSAKLVFCDCNEDGNINPADIEKKITPNSKALIITHMWGVPCDMDEIMRICKKYNLKLLEDCSHAHGARYKGQLVGTFGDVAAWSLQGAKIIPAGQGGILLTDDKKIYDRALLHNEFNRRCWNEISKADELYKYTSTGFGLNHKPHPLGVAVAMSQFDDLESYLYYKRLYAKKIIDSLSSIPFLKMPSHDKKDPSWYAFVMQFDSKIAGCSIQKFHQLLKDQGLNDIDIPQSTRPLHKLALFNEPNNALTKNNSFMLFSSARSNTLKFPNAEKFFDSALKMPVWARAEDEAILDRYINIIKKTAAFIKENRFELEAPRAKL